MSNNKQSSVEWLVEELRKYIQEPWKYVLKGGKEAIIEKAKAMHKEEIKNAYWAGIDDHLNQNKMPNSEGYYNETYGGNK